MFDESTPKSSTARGDKSGIIVWGGVMAYALSLVISVVAIPVAVAGSFVFLGSLFETAEFWHLPIIAKAHHVDVVDVAIQSRGDAFEMPEVLDPLKASDVGDRVWDEKWQEVLATRVRKGIPNEDDHRSAQAWARELVKRLRSIKQLKKWFSQKSLAPSEPWANWLIVQCLGVDEESRSAARQRWESYFPAEREELALAIGRRLKMQRRQAGGQFPKSSTNLDLTCLVERLLGTDEYGIRCRQVILSIEPPKRTSLGDFLTWFLILPNEELHCLSMARLPHHNGGFERISNVNDYVELCLFLFVAFVAARMLIKGLLGKVFLVLRSSGIFRSFEQRHGVFDSTYRRGLFVSFVLTPLLYFPIVLFTLPDEVKVRLTTAQVLAGTYLSLWFNGLLFMSVSLLVAMFLLRFGIDPDKTWLDEILTAPLIVYFLYHFQAGVNSIIMTLVFVLTPQFFVRFSKRSKDRAKELLDGRVKPIKPVDAIDLIGWVAKTVAGTKNARPNSLAPVKAIKHEAHRRRH